MRVMKYLAVLAVALFAFAGASNAQTVQFVGGGSSALFLELGQGASTLFAAGDVCIWSTGTLADKNVAATDPRAANGVTDVQNGKAWVVWNKNGGANCGNPAAGFQVYTYLSVDSVIGDRCFFATDNSGTSGCIANYTPTQAEGNAAGNQLGAGFADSPSTAVCAGTNSPCIIPTTVTAAINNKRWNVAGTDVRPEDAKFATFRALQPCTATVSRNPFGGGLTSTTGLGYNVGGAAAGIGVPIQSFYSAPTFSVIDFSLSGVNDPFSGKPAPAAAVSTVGAQPIVVGVSPAGGTGLGAATDINTFTLTLFYNGVLGRATDLLGPTTNPSFMTVLVREPLSGTFQTFEYSVPNSNQFHTSQELGNCNSGTGAPASNPMNLQSANGAVLTARRRVLGTGEMTAQLAAPPAGENRMGYFFWSAGNANPFTAANAKYLTVNGVDPILDSYSGPLTCGSLVNAPNNGVFPNAANGNLPCVTFKSLNAGDYPIWSALRLVSSSTVPFGVSSVITAVQTLNSTQNDFIPLSRLNVWHSHFVLPQIGVNFSANGKTINTAGDLCNSSGALVEGGGDVGGTTLLKVANADFCADFSNVTGLINANN